MPPNNPPSGQNNNYDFILNPQQPQKPPGLLAGNSMLQRALILSGGVVILIVLAIFGFSLLNSSANAQNQRLEELAQTQAEIIRIAESSAEKTSSTELKNLIVTVQMTTKSSLQDTITALSSRGKKVKDKQLSLGKNPANDELLTEAEQNSRFNEVYMELLGEQLENYLILIEAAHAAGTTSEKDYLSSAYEQVQIIKEDLAAIQ